MQVLLGSGMKGLWNPQKGHAPRVESHRVTRLSECMSFNFNKGSPEESLRYLHVSTLSLLCYKKKKIWKSALRK